MEDGVVFVQLFHKLEMKLTLKRMEQGVLGDFNIWYSASKVQNNKKTHCK